MIEFVDVKVFILTNKTKYLLKREEKILRLYLASGYSLYTPVCGLDVDQQLNILHVKQRDINCIYFRLSLNGTVPKIKNLKYK